MNETGQRLLDAHVQHELSRLQGKPLAQLLEQLAQELFEWLADVPLSKAVTEQRVDGVIDRLVIELRISGGITELAGDMARVVLRSKANEGIRVDEVFPAASFEEFVGKILAFDHLRTEAISLVAHSSALGDASARVLSHGLSEILARRLRALSERTALGMATALHQRVLPEMEQRLNSLLGRQFEQHRDRFANEVERHLVDVLDADLLSALVDDVWRGLGKLPLTEAFSFVGEQDLDDFVVFIHEFWLRFRKTDYLRQVLREAVHYFFQKYGEESAASLIEDMGVTPDIVVRELQVFLVPLFEHAVQTGFAEKQLRAELGSFYASQAFSEALAKTSA